MSLTLTQELKQIAQGSMNTATRKEYMYAMRRNNKSAKKQAMTYARSGFDIGRSFVGDSGEAWVFVKCYDKPVLNELLDSSQIFLVNTKGSGGTPSPYKLPGADTAWQAMIDSDLANAPQVDSSLDSSD